MGSERARLKGDQSIRGGWVGGALPPRTGSSRGVVPHFLPLCNTTPHFFRSTRPPLTSYVSFSLLLRDILRWESSCRICAATGGNVGPCADPPSRCCRSSPFWRSSSPAAEPAPEPAPAPTAIRPR